MTEAEEYERARVVAAAISWERTPYRHGAHVKGKACDCTFIADVYEEAGLIPHVEIESYSPQFMLNQREERYLGYVQRYAHEIRPDEALPGDLVLYRFGRVMSHSAIVIFPGWPSVIHAGQKEQIVTRAEGDKGILGLSPVHRRFFSFWN